jgi:hypothetical protein
MLCRVLIPDKNPPWFPVDQQDLVIVLVTNSYYRTLVFGAEIQDSLTGRNGVLILSVVLLAWSSLHTRIDLVASYHLSCAVVCRFESYAHCCKHNMRRACFNQRARRRNSLLDSPSLRANQWEFLTWEHWR